MANKDDAAKKAEETYKKQLADKDAELAKEKSRIVATRHVDEKGNEIFPTEINDNPHKKDGTMVKPDYFTHFEKTTIENGVKTHHYTIIYAPTDHL